MFGYFAINVSESLQNESGDIQSEQVYKFVYYRCSSKVMHAHELEYCHQFVRAERVVVEFLVQLVNNFEKVLFEIVIICKLLLSL